MNSQLLHCHPSPLLQILLLACLVTSVQARPSISRSSDTTSIVIVGTVHAKTSNFDAQTLHRIIDRVKPDLILVELDSSFFTPAMLIKPELITVSLENRAVSDYVQTRPVPIRPYDIEGRNKIYEQHNYFALQRELSNALNRAAHDSFLGANAQMLFDAIVQFDDIGHTFGSERLEVINSSSCDIAMEMKQYYDGDGMFQIVASVPSLARFTDFCKFKRDFWITRNDAMVNNIANWTKLSRARTILVLCGYEHRYYLRNALQKRSAKEGFAVRDYWSY